MVISKKVGRQSHAETSSVLRTSSLTLSLALFLFLFSGYLLTYSPRFHSSDGLAMFATAESLVRRGEWDADQIRWMGLGQGILGLDGHLYVRKGVGVSLLAVPLVWLGLILPGWGPATTVLLLNALITAATGALLLRYLQALDYPDRVALVAGLAFGLATPAWPYAKTFFSDPLAGLCLLAAALVLLRYRHTGRAVNAFWAGLALALAVAARYANAVMIPIFALLLFNYQIAGQPADQPKKRRRNRPANQPNGQSTHELRSFNRQSLVAILRAWAAFGLPLIAAAIAIAYHNLARYGDPFNTGYLPEESFSGIWWQGIAGLLISPGRGLFLYAPVLLISLAAAPAFFRRHRVEAALAWTVILAHLLLYGKWFMWHGGYAWGPRFMVPTLPFFVMGMAPAIERGKESYWWKASFLTLGILSVLIQVIGLSVHFELFQNWLLDTGLPLFAPITFFALRYSPLVGQFQFLRPKHLDFAWITGGRVDWLLLVALLAAALLSGWGLLRLKRRVEDQRPARAEDSLEPDHRIIPTSRHLIFHPFVLSSLVTLAATAWLLAHAHTLSPSDLRSVVAVLNARSTAVDAIVTGTPDESIAFADLYKGHADVLGLNDGSPLDADTAAALAETSKDHPRVWWLSSWLPPEQSSVEIWLMRNGFRAEDRFVGTRRLALYYFPPQRLLEQANGNTFGGDIVLERVDMLPNVHPGGVLPLALHWRARQSIKADYNVFVHLLDSQGNRVAQADSQPALWTRPTSSWSPGERIEDRHALSLPDDLPPGAYSLIVGLYLPENGERLLTGDAETFVTLGTVQISSK